MLDNTLAAIRRYIPTRLFNYFQPAYHWLLSFAAALWYRFPSRHIKVIAVTGTKGKSSTTEIINAMLEEAGYATAVSNTIRFKVADISSENIYKMSMPGRFFTQKFLRKAVSHKCDYAVVEMTSQGALLNRHRFIQLDGFVFTNLSPEHIEAHGSYENYVAAKVSIAAQLSKSKKKDRLMVLNGDDLESSRFSPLSADRKITYSLKDVEPYQVKKDGLHFMYAGKPVTSHLSGEFNLYNILCAATTVKALGVSDDIIIRAVEKFAGIAGRVQKIEAGQDFTIVVDYAHTADSLEKLYHVFEKSRNICVLGGTGGGRDTKKREVMGGIADRYCEEIILTDEDPYDEDPHKIIAEVARGICTQKPTIILDRRAAIAEALKRARTGDTVLITGKGTDPYIMGPKNTKTPWSDAKIAREEIEKLFRERK